jgi:hypothetical protein
LNEDGTLKTQAGLATTAQLQSLAAAINVAVNGDLDDWSAGGAAAPDNFTLSGAGAAIARTGPGQADTFSFNTGLAGYAAKLTRSGADVKLTQAVIATADFGKMANCKGQKVSAAIKGKTAIASHLRVVVDDGATQGASSYHTGGGSEEHLTVTHTISSSATKLDVVVEVNSSNGDAYAGGLVIVFGDVAPSDWSPLSSPPDATATRRGLVSIGAQTFAGAKTFNVLPTYKLGAEATAAVTPRGRKTTDATVVGNIGGGTADLHSFTIPAGTLDTNGKTIHIQTWGTFGDAGNAKTLTLNIETYTGINTTVTSSAAWWWDIYIVRTSNTQFFVMSFLCIGSLLTNSGVYGTGDPPAETLPGAKTWSGNDIVVKFQGSSSTSTNDAVKQTMSVLELE